MANTPDQTDILAANTALTKQVADLTKHLTDATAAFNTGKAALESQIEALRAEVGVKDTQLAAVAKERDNALSAAKDFETKVAAEVAKHGISAAAAPVPIKSTPVGTGADGKPVKKNYSEMAAQARGFANVAAAAKLERVVNPHINAGE